jgi:hypothetical protein
LFSKNAFSFTKTLLDLQKRFWKVVDLFVNKILHPDEMVPILGSQDTYFMDYRTLLDWLNFLQNRISKMESSPGVNVTFRKQELEHITLSLVVVKEEFFRRYGYLPCFFP